MGLNIKSTRAEAAIRELAARTGEGLTEAVEKAVQERLQRVGGTETARHLLARLKPIQLSVAAARRSRKDKRTSRELLNELYDEHGLPK
jgi:antitoxin VapB